MSSSIPVQGDLTTYGQIVLFGDSITEQSFNPEYFGHGSALANIYTRKCDVINRGFSGYTTVQALDLLPRIFPSRDDKVLLVVLFFGANDAVLPGGQQYVPLQQYLQICETIMSWPALQGKLIVVTPPPIEEHTHEPDFGRTRTAQNTRLYGNTLRELCQKHKVICADVWSAFMKELRWSGDDDSAVPGSLQEPKDEKLASFFRDGLHPVGSGYRIIYDTIYASILTHFPQLAADKLEPHTPYWTHATAPKSGVSTRWRIDTSSWTEEDFSKLLHRVPKSDRERIEKFHYAKDRRMALASVLLQRRFISTILGYPIPISQPIPRDSDNRPYFEHKSVRRHDFNVSHHAGKVALVGVLESGRVGLDITVAESLKTDDTAQGYLASFQDSFSPAEWHVIGNDLARFAQHWALKEAYVKYHGSGIVVDLTEIEFREVKYVNQAQPIQVSAARLYLRQKEQDLRFELQYMDGAYFAIALEVEDESRGFEILSLSDLL